MRGMKSKSDGSQFSSLARGGWEVETREANEVYSAALSRSPLRVALDCERNFCNLNKANLHFISFRSSNMILVSLSIELFLVLLHESLQRSSAVHRNFNPRDFLNHLPTFVDSSTRTQCPGFREHAQELRANNEKLQSVQFIERQFFLRIFHRI